MTPTTVPYGLIDQDLAARFAATPPDEDGPVWMVNLMKYRDRAVYEDGRETDLTGREADDRYAPIGPLAEVGAEILLVADVQDQFLNDDPHWDRVAVVRYPTRAAFLAMQELPEYQELHAHKAAGMEQTFVIATTPFPSPEAPDPSTPLPDWGEVPHPPSPDDGYVQVVHVLRFEDGGVGEDVGDGGGTPGEMDAYTKHATRIAVEQGVRIGGWFKAEGTIVGDGRRWDQVRFNTFPSRAAFMEVVFDPDRLAAQAEHREKAIAETYTLVLRPVLDRLNDPELVASALARMGGEVA
jgi:uncharacterized protein (DUF1330 family)